MGQIEFEGVTKRFGAATALDTVSVAFEAARTTVLVGPSGCGKSTLLNLALGMLTPDTGRVLVRGQSLAGQDLEAFRRTVGTVLQHGGLFPHMTALKNVTLMADLAGWTADQVQARVQELSALSQFPFDLLARFPSELSGGQRQRVALMRALMLDPDIILMDEPFGALDTLVRHALQDELRDVFATLKKTVIMVTHDMAEAAFFADQVVLLNAGQIVQVGPPRALVEAPADPFVTEFLTARRDLIPTIEGRGT